MSIGERWNLMAGDLVHRITIEKSLVSENAVGNKTRTWSTYLQNVSAMVATPSGRKLELTRQLVPTATHVITIRARELDAKEHRVKFGDRVFNIGWVNSVDEYGVRMELICTEER